MTTANVCRVRRGLKLSFRLLQELDFPVTEILTISRVFPHVFATFPYETVDVLPTDRRDLVAIVSKDRDEAIREFDEHNGRIVAAFTPRDTGLRKSHLGNRHNLPSGVVAAFATNNELDDSRVVSMPLGVRMKNLRVLQRSRQDRRSSRTGLVYGNFATVDGLYPSSADGTPHIRVQLAERLRQSSWMNLDLNPLPRSDANELERYYSKIAQHKFVLSPPGRGIDCYRTWESLYLGAIPIVVDSAPMAAFRELPILFTKDYSELSQEYLEDSWRQMSARSYEIARMLRSWYFDKFMEAVAGLDSPRFVFLANDARLMEFGESWLREARTARDWFGEA